MPQVDPELFDRSQFQAELALKASPIAAYKKAIRQARQVLDERFKAGRDIRRLIQDRAWFVDQILRSAWDRFDWNNGEANCTPTPISTCSFCSTPTTRKSFATRSRAF